MLAIGQNILILHIALVLGVWFQKFHTTKVAVVQTKVCPLHHGDSFYCFISSFVIHKVLIFQKVMVHCTTLFVSYIMKNSYLHSCIMFNMHMSCKHFHAFACTDLCCILQDEIQLLKWFLIVQLHYCVLMSARGKCLYIK